MDSNDINSDIFNNRNMNDARLIIRQYYRNNTKLLFYYLALSYCREKKYDEAVIYFISALKEGLRNYLIYYNLGVLYLEKSDFLKSETCFKKSIELNRAFDKGYINLAYIYYKMGDFKRAYRTIKMGTIYSQNHELVVIEKKLLGIM